MADSLLGSLCREMGRLLSRRSQIQAQVSRCRDADLIGRLHGELDRCAERQAELRTVVRAWQGRPGLDPVGIAFLLELTRRTSLA
ncbi:hypothetical protein KQ313_11660 [Synechococcus sp. CS-1325]|nr:hypothetical protein [Synechococcus sp. CS-1325]PZU99667.1 MAG: hypothetical protein DCF24_08565 [Cyanobium sp.]PZV05200.1 MAG: hypothetical protein DCF23_03675 [Cyanobium sp.]